MKKTILSVFLVLLFNLSGLHAQTWSWAQGSTGNMGDVPDIATDHSGNVLGTGGFRDAAITFGSTTLVNATPLAYWDVFVVKYDNAGNLLWAKRTGGRYNDIPNSICVDRDDNVYVAGYFNSDTIVFAGDTVYNPGTMMQAFLLKYDAQGNELWIRETTGQPGVYPYGVASDTLTNDVIFTGVYHDFVVFGTDTLTAQTYMDIFITRYNSAGTLLQMETSYLVGAGTIQPTGIVFDPSGNIFLSGTFMGTSLTFDTIVMPGTGYSLNFFLVKFDPGLNVIWARHEISPRDAVTLDVTSDTQGNAYITGWYDSTITIGTSVYSTGCSVPNKESYIAKYSAAGNLLWSKSSVCQQPGNVNTGYCVVTDLSDNVYLYGGYSSPSLVFGQHTFTIGAQSDPVYMLMMNSGGQVLCTASLASGGQDASGIAVNEEGDLFLGGDYLGQSLTFGSFTLSNSAIQNFFVAKYSCDSIDAIGETEINQGVRIFPNPSEGIFTIDAGQTISFPAALIITDVTGKTIYQSQILNGKTEIDFSGNAAGMYFYRVMDDSGKISSGKLQVY